MSVDNTLHFGLTSRDRGHFTNQYSTPKELSHFQQQTRSFVSTRGLEIEAVATKRITSPPSVDNNNLKHLSEELDGISQFLRPRLISIKVEEGKTLAHSAVLPYYLETFTNKFKEIKNLTGRVDSIHGLSLKKILEEIGEQSTDEEEGEIRNSKIKYFMDALLIISRITRDGLGEDFGIFGKLIPNIQIRDSNTDGNVQVTQLDGVFVPDGNTDYSKMSTLDREKYIRSFAKKDDNFPESVPPILRLPVFEVKANFRPRWTFGNLAMHVPPYLMREITDRFALATINGGVALAPSTVVIVRLRSLGPNYIYHFYPDSNFYTNWRDDILEKLERSKDNLELDGLTELLPFVAWEAASLEQKETDDRADHNQNYVLGEAKQPKLRGLKIGKPINPVETKSETREKQTRPKRKSIKITKSSDRLF